MAEEHPEKAFPRCAQLARDAYGLFTYIALGGMGIFLLWAGFTELDRVTHGAGRVVPQTQNQIVQHLEGGIISEIRVKDGDGVKKGDILLQVENSFSQAELGQAQLDIKAKRVKLTRLAAERAGESTLKFPDDLRKDVPQIIASENEIFRSRIDNQHAQLSIFDEQQKQKELELSELKSRWTNTRHEQDLLAERVASLKKLAGVGAVSRNEMLEAERSMAQLETKLSDLLHDIPHAEAGLGEAQRRRGEYLSHLTADIDKERGETELAIAKLEESVNAMKDRSARSAVLAPISGVVNKVYVTTVGGVVKSGEPLVELVPADASIAVEAKLSPADRAEVWPGLPAVVKISAYEFSIYGGLKGKVIDVSADALQDERGQPYFRVRLEADGTAFGPSRPVVPGMLADVDILTGRHTILQYILKPMHRVLENALRQ